MKKYSKTESQKKRVRFFAVLMSVLVAASMIPAFSYAAQTVDANSKTFRLYVTADSKCTVLAGGAAVKNGGVYKTGTKITVKTKSGYSVKSLSVNKVSKGAVTSYKCIASDINDDAVSVSVTSCADSKVTVKRSGKIQGAWCGWITSIKPEKKKGVSYLKFGETKKYEITAYKGYYLANVKVDGKNAGRSNIITLKGDGKNHSVSASFVKATLKIKIDPGHAGLYNAGAVKGYWESKQVWKLSNYLKPALVCYPGVVATLTKKSLYEDPGVYERGTLAKGNDLFLSIHSNWSDSASADYPLTIVSYANRQFYNVAQPLGVKLAKCVRSVMKTRQSHKVWIKLLASGKDWYGVIRGASDYGVPGIIIEHSFHSNPARARWLMKKSNLKKLAAAEARTIADNYGFKKDGRVTAPNIPASFTLKAAKGRIKAEWKKAPVTGFELFRSGSKNGRYVRVSSTTQRAYSDVNVKSGKTYYYKVRAYRCNGKNLAYSGFTSPAGAKAQ